MNFEKNRKFYIKTKIFDKNILELNYLFALKKFFFYKYFSGWEGYSNHYLNHY